MTNTSLLSKLRALKESLSNDEGFTDLIKSLRLTRYEYPRPITAYGVSNNYFFYPILLHRTSSSKKAAEPNREIRINSEVLSVINKKELEEVVTPTGHLYDDPIQDNIKYQTYELKPGYLFSDLAAVLQIAVFFAKRRVSHLTTILHEAQEAVPTGVIVELRPWAGKNTYVLILRDVSHVVSYVFVELELHGIKEAWLDAPRGKPVENQPVKLNLSKRDVKSLEKILPGLAISLTTRGNSVGLSFNPSLPVNQFGRLVRYLVEAK